MTGRSDPLPNVRDQGCSCAFIVRGSTDRFGTRVTFPVRESDPSCLVHRGACTCGHRFHPRGGIVRVPSDYCPIHPSNGGEP